MSSRKTPLTNKANQYARDIVAGKIPACDYIIKACQRHLSDLARMKDKDFLFTFDAQEAEKTLKFIQLLPHVKGEWAHKRQLITLEPWQAWILACVFGWKKKKNGARRFRIAYIEVPRKNGKSVLAAGVGLKGLCIDQEFGPEIYCGATTERQAWEVFRPARLMVARTEPLQQAAGIEVNAKSLTRPADGGRFEPLIGKPGDGASPSVAIIDEFHEHDSPELIETMLTGMGSRLSGLAFVITTAGFNVEGPCYNMRRQAIEMLDGTTPDDELFSAIYTIDAADDWTDPGVLQKANPNFAISIYGDYLEAQQKRAIKDAAFANTFKIKHLNVWVSSRSAYFNSAKWQELADPTLCREDFEGDDAWVSLDLASTTDIAASVTVFRRYINERVNYYVFADCWIPEERIWDAPRRLRPIYQRWTADGWLLTCEGVEINYRDISRHIIESNSLYNVREVPYDPWGGHQVALDLEEAGLMPVKIPQTTLHLSPPMKELQAAIIAGRIHHDGNPALAWMLGNITAREDANENVFPRKETSEDKIDAGVALIMAISRAMVADEFESPYNDPNYQPLVLP